MSRSSRNSWWPGLLSVLWRQLSSRSASPRNAEVRRAWPGLRALGGGLGITTDLHLKTLLLAAVALAVVACGDAPAPATTQSQAIPSASVAATPTPTVTASPAPAQAVVTFVNAPLTVGRGSNATLQAKTAPNTSCSIEVDYKSGPSKAAGLGPATSDAAGNVSWTWKVGANTTPGAWPITVTCGGASGQTYITVT
jgi:hypothetical protein